MTAGAWVQLGALVAALLVATPLLGRYLAGVLTPVRHLRVERAAYRLTGIDPDREQSWSAYALAVLAFSFVSIVLLYVLQRVQGSLPGNPSGLAGVQPSMAWNTAVSFVTNTNWQSYPGETTMSHLTQMAGLAVQNFLSAAVGIGVAAALIRGLVRQRARTLGNFWVDVTRLVIRVLLPLCAVITVVLVSQGTIQNLHGHHALTTVEHATQVIPGGPVASQEAIKELGTNGGGFFNANSAHPFENPNALTDWLQVFLLLAIPFALTAAYGRMVGDKRQGWVVFTAMALLLGASVGIATWAEDRGNTQLPHTISQSAGNMEGKEVRFGSPASALYAAATTGTSTGSVNASHDSFTPAGGAVPLANIMLGEVSPGGTGSGLYGMLVFALLSVFIAGLMVGRTPEYLGKKIQGSEMKLAVLYLVAVPVTVLGFASASAVIGTGFDAVANGGAHGLSEITYAFASAGNNNGSAFGGITVTSNWYEITLGLAMLVGRFLLIVPVLAIAGSLAAKTKVPATAGTFPTGTPLFAGLLVGVVVIVVGLTYLPVLALGPLAEHLAR